jgi:hypothetical protein
MVANEVVKGAFAASSDLINGLRLGRIRGFGWTRDCSAEGVGSPLYKGDWEQASFSDNDETEVEALRPGMPGATMTRLRFDADEVMGHFQSPENRFAAGPKSLGLLLGILDGEEWWGFLLQHQHVLVTGLDSQGECRAIDKAVFETGPKLDAATNSVETADGRHTWSAVMVSLAPLELRARKATKHPPPIRTGVPMRDVRQRSDESPEREPSVWWNVVQATTWISTLDDTIVDLVRIEGSIHEAYRTIPCASLLDADRETQIESARRRIKMVNGAFQAALELNKACASGMVQMLGRLRGEGEPSEIPTRAWSHLVIHDESNGRPIRAASPNDDKTAPWWTDLRLRSEEVRRRWPASPAAPKVRVAPVSTLGEGGIATVAPAHSPPDPRADRPANGAGNRAYNDDALVQEVLKAKNSGEAKSYRAAAEAIRDKIPGGGTPESRVKRIAAKAAAKAAKTASD